MVSCDMEIAFMDVEEQIAYWLGGSQEDIEAAGVLIEKRKIRQGLFLLTWRSRRFSKQA